MQYKQTALRMALAIAGLTFGVPQMASAIILADGCYDIKINVNPGTINFPTPSSPTTTMTTVPGSNGPVGSWNSNFAFGGARPSASAQGMFDSGPTVVNGRTTGSNTGRGAGNAGVLGIKITGGTFTVSDFQVDPTFLTAGGTFAQYANDTSLMSGTIDQATGAMTFNPTGRLGAVSAFPNLVDEPWNIDNFTVPGATTWNIFTTGVANSVNTGTSAPTTVTGHVLVASGTGANGVLVNGGRCGNAWGGFNGCGYFETWNVSVIPQTGPGVGGCPVITVNPQVTSTSPDNGATSVGTTTPAYSVTYDQAMNTTSGGAGDLTFTNGVTVGAPTVSGNTFTYPISGLAPSTTYTVTFNAGPKSSTGAAITLPAPRTFTTGAGTGATIVAPIPDRPSPGGCAINPAAHFDPSLLGLMLAALGYLGWKRKRESSV